MSKTANEIYEEMAALYTEETGLALHEGGDMALRLRASSVQLESLWDQQAWLQRQCFPQTAEGVYLDYHAQMRALKRLGAAHAKGSVTFRLANPLAAETIIPVGSLCMTAGGISVVTLEVGSIPAGETVVTVAAEVTEAGTKGNLPAGSIVTMAAYPTGVVECTNAGAFTGGVNEESDEQLRRRILDSYKRLPNGANAAWYESRVLDMDGVAAVHVTPRARGIGTVDIILASEGGMPSAELLDEVQSRLDEQREICVDIQVLAPEERKVNITLSVAAEEGYEFEQVRNRVESALRGFFGGDQLGKGVLLAQLAAVVYAVEGVANYAFSQPAADIAGAVAVLPTLGALTITEMGG